MKTETQAKIAMAILTPFIYLISYIEYLKDRFGR